MIFMNRLIEIVKNCLSLGAIEHNDSKHVNNTKISNKLLLKELVDHFNDQMEELSVGRRLLYPMSFNILMHPDDYYISKESLPFVLPEVIAEFYASIKRKRDSYNGNVNFEPPATYWFFQFSACQIGQRDGKEEIIKCGEIVTTGSLTTFDIHKAQQDNVRKEANVHLSVKCQNSNTNDNNINMEALLGMEILSEGSFTFNFDKTLNEDTSHIRATSDVNRKGFATLRWAENDNYKVYDMLDTYIDISGKADNRQTRNICRILNDDISTSHVQIKYDYITQTFSLAAFAKTRLNGRELPISSSVSPQWVTLSKYNSKIFLNDSVSVEFNANSEML